MSFVKNYYKENFTREIEGGFTLKSDVAFAIATTVEGKLDDAIKLSLSAREHRDNFCQSIFNCDDLVGAIFASTQPKTTLRTTVRAALAAVE